MPSLEVELGLLRELADGMQNREQATALEEGILGISLYFKQIQESHLLEMAQLRDEIRILHAMLRERDEQNAERGQQPERANVWREQLQRRAAIELRIRSAIERGDMCAAICVPIPTPLTSGSGLPGLEKFLEELSGDASPEMTAVWSSKIAVVWREQGSPDRRILPEVTKIGDLNYVVRSRSWEVSPLPGENPDAYLKRLAESGKSAHAS